MVPARAARARAVAELVDRGAVAAVGFVVLEGLALDVLGAPGDLAVDFGAVAFAGAEGADPAVWAWSPAGTSAAHTSATP